MITTEKMRIFIKCNGNDDAFALITTSDEKQLISKDWKFINDLVLDLVMLNRNLVSKEMKERIERQIQNSFDSKEAIDLLLSFVKCQI